MSRRNELQNDGWTYITTAPENDKGIEKALEYAAQKARVTPEFSRPDLGYTKDKVYVDRMGNLEVLVEGARHYMTGAELLDFVDLYARGKSLTK